MNMIRGFVVWVVALVIIVALGKLLQAVAEAAGAGPYAQGLVVGMFFMMAWRVVDFLGDEGG